jgi:hypothetical protein
MVQCTALSCEPTDAAVDVDSSGGTGGQPLDGGTPDAGATCEYQGRVYESGAQFSAGDGCNHCGCTDGQVQCTALWCEPPDAGSDAAAPDAGNVGPDAEWTDAGEVDPRAVDVWYFDIPTGAIRWYQIALCEGRRALVWTSFGGSGEPDQDTPIEGKWQGSGLSVVVVYDDPSVEGGPETIHLEYDPDLDTLMTVGSDAGLVFRSPPEKRGGEGGTGTRENPCLTDF